MKRKVIHNNEWRKVGLVLLCVSFLTFLSSCLMEEIMPEPVDVEPIPVRFSTAADTPHLRTSVDGNEWVSGDRIGIFMLTTGGTLPDDICENADNRQYEASPTDNAAIASFIPADADNIYYPQMGKVDFIAYYPYKAVGAGISSNYIYPVDVSDQSDPAAINFMYAQATNISRSHQAVELNFVHLLSKLTLNVRRGTGMGSVDFADITATIIGMPATADFSLSDFSLTPGQAQPFQARKTATASGYDATFEAYLIPSAIVSGKRSVIFKVGGVLYEWIFAENVLFGSGKHYTFELTMMAN